MPIVSDKLVAKPKPVASKSPNQALLETAKTLVTAYGPREAARRLPSVPTNTILSWTVRYGWKQAKPLHTAHTPTPSEALGKAINDDRKRSTIALGKFTRRAAEIAAKHNKPLEIARKVRDVAAVHSTLWPAEVGEGILEIGLLVGKAEPAIDDANDQPVIDVE